MHSDFIEWLLCMLFISCPQKMSLMGKWDGDSKVHTDRWCAL